MPYKHISSSSDTGDLELGTRLCNTCNLVKDINEFHWANGRRHRRRKCKQCMHQHQQRHIIATSTPEKKEKRRRNSYRYKLKDYGMTLEDFDTMLLEQKNQCQICKVKLGYTDILSKPHVDHCHQTGRVRGILCFVCNTGLGKFKDNPELLREAIKYLEKE